MFNADNDLRLNHEEYNDGKYKIKAAGVCDIYDIGGDPSRYDPDISSYICSDEIVYLYSLDYVIFVEKFIEGYFIGEIGRNYLDTPLSNKEDLVYYLMDICMDYIIEDENQHEPLKKLLQYLFRHCKNNNCKVLELKKDSNDRYKPFYDYVIRNYEFIEWNGYLLKKIY